MQPIHLAIGLVEGMMTAGIINYVKTVRPEILEATSFPGRWTPVFLLRMF